MPAESTAKTRLESREELILGNLPLVRYLVGRILPKLPAHLDPQDLISVATIGLINAADRYDPTRGIQFKTFAEQHIRGTILDELRSFDVLSRSMRGKYKQLERKIVHMEHELGRNPTAEEMAQALDMKIEEYHSLLDDLHVFTFISLDDSWSDDEGNPISLADVLSESEEQSPQQQIIRMQLVESLGVAIDSLPEKERIVVTLYYKEEFNLKEIGETLGLTESRISQILSQAMVRLRIKMKLHKN